MNRAIPAPGIRDRADEFEELGGAQDRVGQAGTRDQPLLCQLGPEITAALEPVGADDRQRDAMPYAGLLRSRNQVSRPRLEEVQHRRVLERGRIRHVDDNVGARKRRLQTLPGHGVDAPAWRRLQQLMAIRPVPPMITIFIASLLSMKPRRPAHHYQDEMGGAGVTRVTVNYRLICTTYTGGPHLRTSANGLKFL